jgi:hypothetical protein
MITSIDSETSKDNSIDTLQAAMHCPNCYSIIDAWACKLLCRNCGISFTCDE